MARTGPLTAPVIAAALALLLAPSALAAPTGAAGRGTAQVSVHAKVEGTGDAEALARAAARATPELQAFLVRYVDAAFQPRRPHRGRDLLRFFDQSLHGAVARDLAALSLGDAREVSGVGLQPAGADATFLLEGGQPVAATVVLRVNGTAQVPSGETRVGLLGRFQLLRGAGGWHVIAYETRTRVPA